MRTRKVTAVSRRLFWLAAFSLLVVLNGYGQCVDSSEVNNFRVRSIRFRTLFGRTPKALREKLDSHKGEAYSALKASEYIREINDYLQSDPVQHKYEQLVANKLRFSVKGVYTELDCVKKLRAADCERAFPNSGNTECVDVSIRRYAVEVDALNSGPYLLLLPRSAITALYGAFPKPLILLNPEFDINQDRKFGPSLSLNTVLDLFTSSDEKLAKAEEESSDSSPADPDKNRLLLKLFGRKSFNRPFYVIDSALAFERRRPFKFFQSTELEAKFAAQHLPHGDGELLRNSANIGIRTDLRLTRGPFQLMTLGGTYRRSHNRFTPPAGPAEVATEDGYTARVLADGVVKSGMLRAGFWLDGATPNVGAGHYSRMAGLVGYGKDFVIRRKKQLHKIQPAELSDECWTNSATEPRSNESAIGLELLVGAGRTWGTVPEYARFFGGNPPGQFLYDELGSSGFQSLPAGPILRSFGQKQAGIPRGPGSISGSTSYWHANVTLSLPVNAWSKPLIPYAWVDATPRRNDDTGFESVPDDDLICRDLKYVVKRAVRRTGMTLMINQTAFDSLSDAQKSDFQLQEKPDLTPEEQSRLAAAKLAYAQAKLRVRPAIEAMFNRDILPISDFIADHANIIAVKPLVMFDVANQRSRSLSLSTTRYGVGGGLEIDVVLARFDFGYIFALNSRSDEPRGNFVGRLVFKRLF
jgi:hypothetical protein